MLHAFDFKSHLASRSCEDAASGFRILGVEVWHFDFDDFHQLSLGDLTHLDFVGFFRTGSKARDLLEKVAGRGLLGVEGE